MGAGNSNLVKLISVPRLDVRVCLLGMSVWTAGADRTEASQPVDTENSPDVTVATVRTVPTEAPVVPWTVPHLGLRVNM